LKATISSSRVQLILGMGEVQGLEEGD